MKNYCLKKKKGSGEYEIQLKRFFHGQANGQLSGDGLFVSKLSPTTVSLNNRFQRFGDSIDPRYFM